MGYIKVQVILESKTESVSDIAPDTVLVAVREKAERGLANRRVLQLLGAHFGKGKRVRLVSGHHSPHKIVSVD